MAIGDPGRTTSEVSVVIPAFNSAKTIALSVQSALTQSIGDLEVIVVDDGSSDATAEIVAQISDPRVIVVSQTNRGLPAARNAGIDASHGTYIAFLDSDDLLLPDFLERGLEALSSRSNPGFAYTDAYVLDEATGRIRERSAMAPFGPPVPPPESNEEFLAALMKTNFVYVSTIVPRIVLNAVGRFNEARTSCEDYDLWLRIMAAGYEPAWFTGRHAIYRLHPGQMTRNATRMARNLAAVYDELPLDAMPTPRHVSLLRRRRRRARAEVLLLAPLKSLVPERVMASLRGKKSRWYPSLPAEIAEAFPRLR